jgi:hypothetical protein
MIQRVTDRANSETWKIGHEGVKIEEESRWRKSEGSETVERKDGEGVRGVRQWRRWARGVRE